MKRHGLWLVWLTLLWLLPVATVFADGVAPPSAPGKIFLGEDISLEAGQVYNGDLGVFDGNLAVPENCAVNGDVFVVSGSVDLAGRVNGNLAVIRGALRMTESGRVEGNVLGVSGDQEVAGHVGGDLSNMFGEVQLRRTAVIEGDVTTISGILERQAGARILGKEISEIFLPQPRLIVPEGEPPWKVASPPPPYETLGQRIGRFVGRVFTAGFFSLLAIGLGLLIVYLWPRTTRRVAEGIAAMPIQSFGLGLLTFLIAAVLESLAMVLMILIILLAALLISTVILIPVGLLLILLSGLVLLPVPLALTAAIVLGWVGLAELIGRRIFKALNREAIGSIGAVLVGLLITVSLSALLWIIKPVCCAWPFIILMSSIGLGAVIYPLLERSRARFPQPSQEAPSVSAPTLDQEEDQTGEI